MIKFERKREQEGEWGFGFGCEGRSWVFTWIRFGPWVWYVNLD